MLSAQQLVPPPDYEHRMKIVAALKSLMGCCSFNEVSVKQICEEGQISRSTFYRYFSDKFMIVQWHSDMLASAGVFKTGRGLSWYEGVFFTAQGHKDYEQLYKKAARAKDYNSLGRHAERARKKNLIETLTEYRHIDLTNELIAQVEAVTISETVTMMRWMTDGMVSSPAEIARLVTATVPCYLRKLVEGELFQFPEWCPVLPSDSAGNTGSTETKAAQNKTL